MVVQDVHLWKECSTNTAHTKSRYNRIDGLDAFKLGAWTFTRIMMIFNGITINSLIFNHRPSLMERISNWTLTHGIRLLMSSTSKHQLVKYLHVIPSNWGCANVPCKVNLGMIGSFDFLQGVGYSYSDDGNYTTGDHETAQNNLAAVRSFFRKFPEFVKNDFYITGRCGHYPEFQKFLSSWPSMNC